jgi:phosphoribosyl-ATP pyrophosphohydrolase/phosphoribosyl-AMP cyclohydrolase
MKALLPQIQYDASGLVPAIVQDISTSQVLMLAYMNKESLQFKKYPPAT